MPQERGRGREPLRHEQTTTTTTTTTTRLWCVFELAAFRTANPDGKITPAPLYLEVVVAVMWLGGWMVVLATRAAQVLRTESFPVPFFLPGLAPTLLLFHAFRKSLARKRQLFDDLDNFDLSKVHCTNEEDKKFIHSAIVEWYGSLDGFAAYVRGPLRKELLAEGFGANIPLSYALVVATPLSSYAWDGLAGLIRAGAPISVQLSYLAAIALQTCTFGAVVCIQILAFFGGCCAGRRRKSIPAAIMESLALSLALTGCAIVIVRGGVAGYERGVAASCLVLVLAVLATWIIHGGYKHALKFTSSCQSGCIRSRNATPSLF